MLPYMAAYDVRWCSEHRGGSSLRQAGKLCGMSDKFQNRERKSRRANGREIANCNYCLTFLDFLQSFHCHALQKYTTVESLLYHVIFRESNQSSRGSCEGASC